MSTLKLLTGPSLQRVKASSVLHGSSEFSAKHAFDYAPDSASCWNSEQGSPQFLTIEFSREVRPLRLELEFQGGFVGQDMVVETGTSPSATLTEVARPEQQPADVNTPQAFDLAPSEAPVKCMRITFNGSTDMFGRVTVYTCKVFGEEA